MARKVHAGKAGGQSIAGIEAITPTRLTARDDLDIEIDAEGTGNLVIGSSVVVQDQFALRFEEADGNGENYVAFQAPASISSDVTWTLPAADGSNRQIMQTNGSGTLTFVDPSLVLTDEGASSNLHNLLFTVENATGTLDTAFIDNGVMTYQPSTETLTISAKLQTVTSENVQTSSYTLALSDRDQVVAMNNTTASTVTVPPNSSVAFPIGSIVYISRINTGSVTLAAGSGVTLSQTGDLGSGEEIAVRKRGTDEWAVLEERQYFRSGSGGTTTNQTTAISHSYTSTGADTFTVS